LNLESDDSSDDLVCTDESCLNNEECGNEFKAINRRQLMARSSDQDIDPNAILNNLGLQITSDIGEDNHKEKINIFSDSLI